MATASLMETKMEQDVLYSTYLKMLLALLESFNYMIHVSFIHNHRNKRLTALYNAAIKVKELTISIIVI